MSNELQWTPLQHHDQAMERLKPFTEPLSPAVAAPTESHLEEFASVIENIIVPRLLMNLSCSFDHRVVDGQQAAQFVQALRGLLECPAMLFVD